MRLLLVLICGALCAQEDRRLSFRSIADGTMQPYRLYRPARVPDPAPLVIALHGTGGDENTLLDSHPSLRSAADRFGVIVMAPLGRGVTEYRGIGELDVLEALRDVRSRYSIDERRIYLTGHSMGGTGSAYLAMRHPDVFAAYAPLAAAYSYPWIARNAAALPSLWIGGAEDAEYYHRGVAPGVERLRKFGSRVVVETLPGEGHGGPVKYFERVFEFLVEVKRDPHPRRFVFEVDTPLHGCAFWICVETLTVPGRIGTLHAEAPGGNRVEFRPANIAEFTFVPDETFLDGTRPVNVALHGVVIWSAPIPLDSQLRITAGWTAALEKRVPRPLTWRTHRVGTLPKSIAMTDGLGAWIAEAMRRGTGAELAMYGGWAYRGLPLPAGDVDIVDLIQCSRPFDQNLVTVRLTGLEIQQILDDNVPHPKKDQPLRIDTPGASRLVRAAGFTYSFDAAKPDGQKITAISLDPVRTYTVALEAQTVERESMLLAGKFRRLDYTTSDTSLTMALYGYAMRGGL
ncbi:MAG: hypothetical protein FJW30_05575 [Acidobacteria bacterium]|nr:hypothetical protein [Acidobacteriota bacterium]